MNPPATIMTTWSDGLIVVTGETVRHELAGHSVGGVVADGRGGAVAIVDRHTLHRRTPKGEWLPFATTEAELACFVIAGPRIYAGTDDARVLAIGPTGRAEPLTGLDSVAGRDRWFAGSAIVNGVRMGPPLGIRSMTITCDGGVLLANVHVGGIPRSTDGGVSWQPTIDIDVDVHQVLAHPTRPALIAAAAGAGLCISRDAGATWTVETSGLPASYCSAVAFAGDEVWVSASTDHFAAQGAVYRRRLDEAGPLEPIGAGLPRWLTGICDTGCIDVRGPNAVIADREGKLYRSQDAGRSWSCLATGHPQPSAVAIL
jgi:hypothetical protein